MKHVLTLPEYEAAVSIKMKRRYGITWYDASGDAELLDVAMADRLSAETFVTWFGERYDLAETRSYW